MDRQPKYKQEIQQMMFVSGETGEISSETTTLVEDIVHQQVVELFTRGSALAVRRGVRTVSTDDLIFLIRHDKAKVSRLKTFLAWKDVRRKARDDDKGPADPTDFAAGEDVLTNISSAAAANPVEAAGNGADAAVKKPRKQKIGLPWDINNLYPIDVPDWVGIGPAAGSAADGDGGTNEAYAADEDDDEEEEEQNFATRQRLRAADKRTQHMTREEYVFFSECRQASFTYRKNKRFREWAGFQNYTDSRPNEDVVDMFGFLTLDIVQRLTEEALRVKEQEDKSRRNPPEKDDDDNKPAHTPGSKKRKREKGLFQPSEETRTPVESRHIHEAFRRLQTTPNKSIMMMLHEGRPRRLPLKLI